MDSPRTHREHVNPRMNRVTRRTAWGVLALAGSAEAVERQNGGPLGVAVLDVGAGKRLAHRAEKPFPMCCTFELLAAALVLARVDRCEESGTWNRISSSNLVSASEFRRRRFHNSPCGYGRGSRDRNGRSI